MDQGYYLCAASNNIGAGLSKVVNINVNGKHLDNFKLIINNYA